ncbi:MAG: amidohydrolase, partial [Anaerolineae bacterium]|nr:amidohydrolase [Anaerolineae bacterium]
MLDKAKALAPELVRLRRDIHRHPELSFQEVRTAKLVADTLAEIGGIQVRTGIAKTGVIGELGTGTGRTIAIRADMDALPILEKTDAPYASIHEGVMHACGHDAHTAILLGVAHLLKESFAHNGLQGNVRFIFQPAEEQEDEEGKSGGLRMVEENAMAGVDAIIALHVDATQPFGIVSSQAGWNS